MIATTTFGETAESVLPAAATAEPHEFSLVAGGPLFRLMCSLKLADSALGHLDRRLLVALVIIWLPLLVLTVIEGHGERLGVADRNRAHCEPRKGFVRQVGSRDASEQLTRARTDQDE